ncbi:MAG: hypothetical protein AAF829_03485 [Pseudomonadota bacterium]
MLAATSILGVVRAVFGMSQSVKQFIDTRAQLQDMAVLIPQVAPRNPEAVATALLSNDDFFGPSGVFSDVRPRFSDVIDADEFSYFISADADAGRRSDLIAEILGGLSKSDGLWDERFGPVPSDVRGDMNVKDQFYLHEIKNWESADSARRDRNSILFSAIQLSFSVLSAGSHKLGVGPDAQGVVATLASSLNTYFDTRKDHFVETAFSAGMPKRMLDMFISTSLDMAASRPELFSEEQHVQSLVSAVAEPLRTLNVENAGQDMSTLQRFNSVRQTLRGPIAMGLLESLHENRRLFFDNYPEKTEAAGVVTEALFQGVIDQAQAAPDDIRQVFAPGFVRRSFPLVLQAVSESPEAFVRGKGQHVVGGQELLGSIVSALHTHLTVEKSPKLTQSLFEIGMQITRKHARTFVVDEARRELAAWSTSVQASNATDTGDTEPWAAVGIRVVSRIANGMISRYMEQGISMSVLPLDADLDFLLEVVGMIADQAAQTPGMILPNDVNDEVVQIAEGIAAFIASEHASLLTRHDWKRVSAKAADLAMKNPGALFSLDASNPREHLAVQLITQVLGAASTSLQDQATGGLSRQGGRLMFGETLSRALMATLETAVSNAKLLASPQSVPALINFVGTLNEMAADNDTLGGRSLSADDWIYAFRWFASEAIADPGTPIPVSKISEIVLSAERRALASNGSGAPESGLSAPQDFDPSGATNFSLADDDGPVINPVFRDGALG